MKIQRSTLDGGVTCLTVSGEFDAFATNPFLEQIDSSISSGINLVVVNPRLVLFINSTAVGCLIKARKRLRGLGGDLVLSEPSERVRETLKTLGLDQVIRSFDHDGAAAEYLTRSEADEVAIPSENAVLVRFKDSEKASRYRAGKGVARMVSLEEDGINFHATGDADLFSAGTEVRVKFRLPLFRRAYYFDVPATVGECKTGDDGVSVFAEFGEMYEEDRKSIAQFLRDMRLLREEARSSDD